MWAEWAAAYASAVAAAAPDTPLCVGFNHWEALLPELLARVQALIRRSQSAASSRMVAGPLELDVATREAQLHGQPLPLTAREWDLLLAMALAAPGVVAKRRLADSVSRWDKEITDNAIEIYVSRLRAKLVTDGISIRTVRGIGYRLDF
jgi:DNA-binding response OmpR family regulator